jgi:polysaccharide biosynthesis protein PelD
MIVTALLPGMGWLIDPGDPFFTSGFPWVVMAPLLLGLQNGFRYALVSSLCLLGGAAAHWRFVHAGAGTLPVEYLLSVGLLGPLAGEYRNKWQRAFDATRRDSQQRGQRLEQVARAYHLLERSHTELEQRIAGGGRSLEAALVHVHARLRRSGARALAEAGDSILQLVSHYGQVQVATLYRVRTGGGLGPGGERSMAELEVVASLGQAAEVDLEHPMVRDALDSREVTSVREERMAIRDSAPLACVPLVDSSDHLWGVILVHEMPFVAMSEQNMKLLAVLGGRVGDWLAECAQSESAPESAPESTPSATAPVLSDAAAAAPALAGDAATVDDQKPAMQLEEAAPRS